MEHKIVRCFAEGSSEGWEAFCADFDLAVQGKSFEEVYRKLNEQIELYLEEVATLPEADRARLLNRSMPFYERLRLTLSFFRTLVAAKSSKARHEYTQQLPDMAHAA